MAHAAEIELSESAPIERFNFEQTGIKGWKTVDG